MIPNNKRIELNSLEQFSNDLGFKLKQSFIVENSLLIESIKISNIGLSNLGFIDNNLTIKLNQFNNNWANILSPGFDRSFTTYHNIFDYFKVTGKPIKNANLINTKVDLDLLNIPHLESIAIPIQAYSNEQKLSFNETINYVFFQALATLESFKLTKDHHTFLHFKRLMAYYKDLIRRCNRKIRNIIGRIKFGLRKIYLTDFRAVLRIRIRIISRNIDDEHFIVMNTPSSKGQIHYFNLSSNEKRKYKRINKQF